MSEFRHISSVLADVMADLGFDDGADHLGQQPGVATRHDFPDLSGVKKEADPVGPASWRDGGQPRRGFVVFNTGRAARTATNGQPRPVARPALITVDGMRVHG